MRLRIVALAIGLLVVAACGKETTVDKNNEPTKNNSTLNNSSNNTTPNNVTTNIAPNNVLPGDMGGGDMGGGDMAMTSCGDGVVDAGEQCDDGAANDDLGNGTCRTSCLLATCGDGGIDFIQGETCDDGDTVPGDGCSATCTREPMGTCGDGTVDANEECDLGIANSDQNPDACRTNCLSAFCGDGVGDTFEECDDGNNRDADGCAADCTAEVGATCGDGALDIADGEECDDGGTLPGDGCSATCQFEPPGQMCQDGVVDPTEKCDDMNPTNGDGCNPTCNLRGEVTTLLPVGQFGVLGQGGITVDQTRLWLSGSFQLGFVTLDAACLNTGACTFTATAGNGTSGYVDNADGAMAQITFVEGMATDGNTLWFFDSRSLRAMSTTPPYGVTTVAGDPASAPNNCAAIDGIGPAARFYGTRGLTYYNGILYFLDGCTGVLRQFDPSNNMVTTIAGTQWQPTNPAPPACNMGGGGTQCNAGTAVDGFGFMSAMVSPRYMASDNAGMLYITDTNGEMLRTYNTVTGYLGTLAGGTMGYVDAVGTAAQLDRPRGLTSDGASLYWSEQNQFTVRQVEIATAEVTTLAGQRGCTGSANGIGGTGVMPNCSNGPGTQARFATPFNIVYHYPSRSLFVRDSNGVRRVE